MKRKLCLGVGIVLFLTACMGSPSYPDWYKKLNQDTSRYAYGTGEGYDKEEAVIRALNVIASKISVSVESTSTSNINITTEDGEESYHRNVNQNVVNYVEKVELSNYKVQKVEEIDDNKYAVLVRVDKELNANLLLSKIDEHIKEYNQLLSGKGSNPVETFKRYGRAKARIENEDMKNCSIAKGLYPSSRSSERSNILIDIKNKMKQYQDTVSFSVQCNLKGYENILVDEISSKGFATQGAGSSIQIVGKIQEKELAVMGNNILKAKIELSVQYNGMLLGKELLSVGAKSRTSYKQAKEFTLRNFRKRLKEKHIIEKLLGI